MKKKYDYDYATTLIADFVIEIAWLAYSWTKVSLEGGRRINSTYHDQNI
jgi:hypothetical protein